MSKKYVYIFTNTKNDFIKIGKTDKYPEMRAEQLTRQTGSIGKYEVAWFKEVEDNKLAENILHYFFRPFHVEKEYFLIKKKEAIPAADIVLDSVFGAIKSEYEKLKINFEKELRLLSIAAMALKGELKNTDSERLEELGESVSVLKNAAKKVNEKLTKIK